MSHVGEHRLPPVVRHDRRVFHRRMEHPRVAVFGVDPVHHERLRLVHPPIDVGNQDSVLLEDLHDLHLEAEVVLAGDRAVAAHEDDVGRTVPGEADPPLRAPAGEALDRRHPATELLGNPRRDAGALLRFEGVVVDGGVRFVLGHQESCGSNFLLRRVESSAFAIVRRDVAAVRLPERGIASPRRPPSRAKARSSRPASSRDSVLRPAWTHEAGSGGIPLVSRRPDGHAGAMNLKVSVLGAGSFGTTMAHVISRNAPTLLWCRRADMAEEINREHRNSTYLPDAPRRVPARDRRSRGGGARRRRAGHGRAFGRNALDPRGGVEVHPSVGAGRQPREGPRTGLLPPDDRGDSRNPAGSPRGRAHGPESGT